MGNAIGISSFWVLMSVLIGGGLFGFAGMALGVPVFAVIYRYIDKITTARLKHKEKDTTTAYYFSLEPYGLEDDEVELDHERKKQKSLFDAFRKTFKDPERRRKFIYDNERPSGSDSKDQPAATSDKENNR